MKKSDNKKEARDVVLDELEPNEGGHSLEDIHKLDDIYLDIRVEFARVDKKIEEILSIKKGDVIKLNRFVGEYVDIFVENRIFARGEITVIDDCFGVRIVEILPPDDKIK